MRIGTAGGLLWCLFMTAPAAAQPHPEDGGRKGGDGPRNQGQEGAKVTCENRTVDNYPACAPSNRARVRVCTGADGRTIKFLRCLN